jgi:hypothetical protein
MKVSLTPSRLKTFEVGHYDPSKSCRRVPG